MNALERINRIEAANEAEEQAASLRIETDDRITALEERLADCLAAQSAQGSKLERETRLLRTSLDHFLGTNLNLINERNTTAIEFNHAALQAQMDSQVERINELEHALAKANEKIEALSYMILGPVEDNQRAPRKKML